ncbi:Ferripyoverdine receptor precursor [Suttonella ornithocola]|uniref:Ferripyoverdine receptor n=1 Tax=Suttonella ornithocola TaxID=279832 RepID=A0A380MLL0_9GAMM|nr:TonB-dependent receptor plug domain-containing protein [Suttonella ornithocola]SUO93202.1 Ferripyoverdine receptor precursor [Suttonella ornithocola]
MRHTLLTLAILSATSAHAQNAIRLDAITVEGNKLFNVTPTEQTHEYTAQAATVGTKIPATLRDIPQSVSIITTQNITDRNVQTFDQLARQTTGLRVLSNDDGRSSVYARGYEYDEYSIDGLPAQMESINGNLPNLSAFDRVEVMRGPYGLFNSTTEMGGVVNFVRKRPTETTQAEITGGLSYPKGYQL